MAIRIAALIAVAAATKGFMAPSEVSQAPSAMVQDLPQQLSKVAQPLVKQAQLKATEKLDELHQEINQVSVEQIEGQVDAKKHLEELKQNLAKVSEMIVRVDGVAAQAKDMANNTLDKNANKQNVQELADAFHAQVKDVLNLILSKVPLSEENNQKVSQTAENFFGEAETKAVETVNDKMVVAKAKLQSTMEEFQTMEKNMTAEASKKVASVNVDAAYKQAEKLAKQQVASLKAQGNSVVDNVDAVVSQAQL